MSASTAQEQDAVSHSLISVDRIGEVNPDEVVINISELSAAINHILVNTRITPGVTPSSICVYHVAENTPPGDVMQAIGAGAKLFDALYYFACTNRADIDVKPMIRPPPNAAETINTMKRNLLAMTMYILIRGSYPTELLTDAPGQFPKFITQILKYTDLPKDLCTTLSSFKIECVPLTWVKSVPLHRLPAEVQQRLAVGIAGYRTLAPFRFYPCMANAPEEVKRAYEIVKTLACQPPTWEVFSATRSPQMIAASGPLNKNLEHLMTKCFTPAQLTEMSSNDVKILFRMPVADIRATQWKSWTTTTFSLAATQIFRATV